MRTSSNIFAVFFFITINTCLSQTVTWQKILTNSYESAKKTQLTSDGGFISIGQDRQNNLYQICIIKQNYLGDTLWRWIYGGVTNHTGFWIEETHDSGLIVGGSKVSAAIILRLNSTGNLIWQKDITDSGAFQCYCVKETNDRNFILSCRTNNDNSLTMKIDEMGNNVWSFLNEKALRTYISEIRVVKNSGFITAGVRWQTLTNSDFYVVRIDLNGNILWTKTYVESGFDGFHSVDTTSENGFIFGGSSTSFNTSGNSQSIVVKTDSSGNIQWKRTYANAARDWCYSIRNIDGKKYIIAGASELAGYSQSFTMSRILDNMGDVIYQNYFAPGNDENRFNSVEITPDKGFIFGGGAGDYGFGYHFFIVKTDSTGYAPVSVNSNTAYIESNDFKLFQNFPNPFNPKTIIKYDLKRLSDVKLSIYDVKGNLILSLLNNRQPAGSYSIAFDGSKHSSGVYFYILKSGIISITRKMLLIK